MQKATKWLLAAAFVVAVSGSGAAIAADRAGIGLEWGWAPTINLNGFSADFSGSTFALDWKVTDSFTVGVASGQGFYSGSHEYTDNTLATPINDRVAIEGRTSVSTLQILTTVPVLTFLQAGLEAGVMYIGASTDTYVYSDGSIGGAADFGGSAGISGNQTASVIGVMAKATLLHAESKTVSADIAVSGGLRFVNLPELYAFGTQEVNSTAVPLKKIDPITNFNSLALGVTAALWF